MVAKPAAIPVTVTGEPVVADKLAIPVAGDIDHVPPGVVLVNVVVPAIHKVSTPVVAATTGAGVTVTI